MKSESTVISISVVFFALCLFLIGIILGLISYPEIALPSVLLVYVFFGLFLLFVFGVKKKLHYKAFLVSFSVFLFWFGISSVYYVFFEDSHQNLSDPNFFYRLATNDVVEFDLVGISILSEGALAVFIWKTLYDFFFFIGFDDQIYIGILFNCLILSLVCVTALNIVIALFGIDINRLKLFLILFNSCSIFWLFATIHIRDSVILLLNTYLILLSVKYIMQPTIKKRFLLGILFLSCTFVYPFLRTEFVFVPTAILLSMVFAYVVQIKGSSAKVRYFFLWAITIFTMTVVFSSQISVFDTLLNGKENYESEIGEISSQSSLGVAFVVNQPIFIRLFIGSIYLHIYPIPFWYGFQLNSIYDLYKSLQVIFLWFTLPLFVIGLRSIFAFQPKVSNALVFLFLLYLGFTLAISITSLETRHIGVFAIPLIIISIIPDFRSLANRSLYKIYLMRLLTVIYFIHISWAFLKFF